MKTLTLALGGSLLVAPAFAETPIPGIDGSWSSLACELRPQVGQDGSVQPWYLKRRIIFEYSRIEAHFTTYGDKNCSFPLVDLSFAGGVEVVGPSEVADGKAFDANLTINEFVRITPLAEPFVEFVSAAGCGGHEVKVGSTMSVLESGCEGLGLQPNTPTVEYEVLMVENDHLYFGARPVSGQFLSTPDDRPGTLEVPVVRN